MRELVKKENERIYAKIVGTYVTNATEDVLSDALQTRFKSIYDGSKQALFHFILAVLNKMARNGSSENLFEQIVEHWNHL